MYTGILDWTLFSCVAHCLNDSRAQSYPYSACDIRDMYDFWLDGAARNAESDGISNRILYHTCSILFD